jgi:hypothetical protein
LLIPGYERYKSINMCVTNSRIIPVFNGGLTGMPEVTKTEVGRRLFQVHREKGVENAIKKIHHGIGEEWKLFSEGDIKVLERMLGECWVYIDSSVWENIAFSQLTYSEIRHIIQIGDVSKGKDSTDTKAIEDVTAILTATVKKAV